MFQNAWQSSVLPNFKFQNTWQSSVCQILNFREVNDCSIVRIARNFGIIVNQSHCMFQKCSTFAPALLYFAERDSLVGVLLGNRVVLHIHDKRLLALLTYS